MKPVCSKCGGEDIEKILTYKTYQTMKWDSRNSMWVLKDTKIGPATRTARHFCNNCNYYQKIEWNK